MTPISTIAEVSFKLESTNPSGSAKDRALPLQIDRLKSLGFTEAVISSSGNAAISAAHFCQLEKIPLTIFLPSHVNPHKLKLIKSFKFPIVLSPQPNSQAFRFSKTKGAYYLRQSTDPSARIGYSQIGTEINSQYPQATSLIIPVGSGSTLLGISDTLLPTIKLIAAQPASSAPICSHFDSNFDPETFTVTDALSVKMLPLKSVIIDVLSSRGRGVVVQNDLTQQAVTWLKDNDLNASAETALCLAALWKLRANHSDLLGPNPLILATGCLRI
jgi:threonine synthase